MAISGARRISSLKLIFELSFRPLVAAATKSRIARSGTTVDKGNRCSKIGPTIRIAPKPAIPKRMYPIDKQANTAASTAQSFEYRIERESGTKLNLGDRPKNIAI